MPLDIHSLNVGFNVGSINEKHVIRGLNLTLDAHDFVCVLGSNGAGKSTLLNAILGQVPYSGSIALNGAAIDKWPQHKRTRHIGIVYQDPLKGTAPNLTVEENLLLSMRTKGTARRADTKAFLLKAKEELAKLGLGIENSFKLPCNNLSGGMRQVVTLYMATSFDAELLLLDEHTAALDPSTAEKVMQITQDIVTSKGVPALMVTHNLDFALAYGNRLIVLNQGNVVFDVRGKEKEALTREQLLSSYASVLSDRALLQNE